MLLSLERRAPSTSVALYGRLCTAQRLCRTEPVPFFRIRPWCFQLRQHCPLSSEAQAVSLAFLCACVCGVCPLSTFHGLGGWLADGVWFVRVSPAINTLSTRTVHGRCKHHASANMKAVPHFVVGAVSKRRVIHNEKRGAGEFVANLRVFVAFALAHALWARPTATSERRRDRGAA